MDERTHPQQNARPHAEYSYSATLFPQVRKRPVHVHPNLPNYANSTQSVHLAKHAGNVQVNSRASVHVISLSFLTDMGGQTLQRKVDQEGRFFFSKKDWRDKCAGYSIQRLRGRFCNSCRPRGAIIP